MCNNVNPHFPLIQADLYASFMDVQLAPHLDHSKNNCIATYQDEIMAQIAQLTPSTDFNQLLDLCLRMGAHEDGWPFIPVCQCATKSRVSTPSCVQPPG